jgi:hypothetical protein
MGLVGMVAPEAVHYFIITVKTQAGKINDVLAKRSNVNIAHTSPPLPNVPHSFNTNAYV